MKRIRRWVNRVSGRAASHTREALCSRALNTKNPAFVKQAKRLHLGCGATIMDGWLNADLVCTPLEEAVPPEAWRRIGSIFIMDATEPFPFADGQFDFIYCEDFMEHFGQKDGLSIAVECFRTLRPGGVWRLSTPNLDNILPNLDLTRHDTIERGHWNWGHQLIYTANYAQQILAAVGFDPVLQCKFGESAHEALRGVDSRVEQQDLNLVIEATKPL